MLWRIGAIKGLCRAMVMRGISVRNSTIYMTFSERTRVAPEAILRLLDKYKNKIVYKNGREPQLIMKTVGLKQGPLEWLEEILPKLALNSK